MRLSRRTASSPLAVALLITLAYQAAPQTRVPAGEQEPAEHFGAACWVRVIDSKVTAYCRNPYPETDHLSLHIECARWWDIDTDSARVAAGPARTVRLAGRCWKEVAQAWVSHRRGS